MFAYPAHFGPFEIVKDSLADLQVEFVLGRAIEKVGRLDESADMSCHQPKLVHLVQWKGQSALWPERIAKVIGLLFNDVEALGDARIATPKVPVYGKMKAG